MTKESCGATEGKDSQNALTQFNKVYSIKITNQNHQSKSIKIYQNQKAVWLTRFNVV